MRKWISLVETTLGEQIAFHGSPKSDLEYLTPQHSTDEQRFGYGVYLTTAREFADDYTNKGHGRTGAVYSVNIPDDDELLDLDATYGDQNDFIKKTLKVFTAPNEFASLWDRDKFIVQIDTPLWKSGVLGKFPTREDADNFLANLTGRRIYTILARNGGNKAASEDLHRMGIKGNRYHDDTGHDAINYVIFDKSSLRIVDRD